MAILVAALALPTILAGCTHESEKVRKIAQEVYAQHTPAPPIPPKPFASDGCSCWPDGDWVKCCVEHDLVYWAGGTREEREAADRELARCVSEKGRPFMARIMYLGVRAGGVWWLPTTFRWGFGWDFPQSGPPGKPY